MSKKSRKIALYDPSEYGGITQYTFGLAEGLTNAGWKVTVITSEDYELRNLKRRFEVWFLFKKSWLKPTVSAVLSLGRTGHTGQTKTGPAAGDRLRSLRITLILYRAALLLFLTGTRIVHVQWLMDARADLRFMRLLRLLGVRVVYTAHDLMPHDEYTPDNRAFYQRVYDVPDKLIVHSEHLRKEMLQLFAIDAAKLCVIPPGCPTMWVDLLGESENTARRQLGIADGARVILFLGQIKRYKGLEYLFEAFETISARCDSALLLVAGRISERDPDVHRHFEALLARYSQHPRVRITDAYIPFEQIFTYMSAADLVVLPYLKASNSGVLLLAYAAGKPVVVTDTGGLSEVVRHGQSGFVVPCKNPGALAEAAVKILCDPDVRKSFAAQSKVLGETVYSWDAISAATAAVYNSFLVFAGES